MINPQQHCKLLEPSEGEVSRAHRHDGGPGKLVGQQRGLDLGSSTDRWTLSG